MKKVVLKSLNTIVVVEALRKNVKVTYWSLTTKHLNGEHIRKNTTIQKVVFDFVEVFDYKVILED